MVVVLPAPFGPSRPKHSPASIVEVETANSLDFAVIGLAQIATLDGDFHIGMITEECEPSGSAVATFRSSTARRFSRKAEMPSCASAARAFMRHDFLGVSVGFGLVEVDLGVEGLLAQRDSQGAGIGDACRPACGFRSAVPRPEPPG